MKFQILMKTQYTIDIATDHIDDEEEREEIKELCSKWFRYNEYVKLEVDTDKKTCIVIEN